MMNSAAVVEIGDRELEALKRAADETPLKRSRICLHASPDSAVQEMIIAFHRDSYIRPHRHLDKQESFHVFAGRLSVALFDDRGGVERWVHLSAEDKRYYRLNGSQWHTVVLRSDYAIIQEVTNGPFVAGTDNFAPWSSDAQTPEAVAALEDWRRAAEADLEARE